MYYKLSIRKHLSRANTKTTLLFVCMTYSLNSISQSYLGLGLNFQKDHVKVPIHEISNNTKAILTNSFCVLYRHDFQERKWLGLEVGGYNIHTTCKAMYDFAQNDPSKYVKFDDKSTFAYFSAYYGYTFYQRDKFDISALVDASFLWRRFSKGFENYIMSNDSAYSLYFLKEAKHVANLQFGLGLAFRYLLTDKFSVSLNINSFLPINGKMFTNDIWVLNRKTNEIRKLAYYTNGRNERATLSLNYALGGNVKRR